MKTVRRRGLTCPHCGFRLYIWDSAVVGELHRAYCLSCDNLACAAGFLAVLSIGEGWVGDLSLPPSMKYRRYSRRSISIGLSCPVCQQQLIVRTSKRRSNLVYRYFLRCPGERCGSRFAADFVFIREVSPSGDPDPYISRQLASVKRGLESAEAG